MKRIITTVFACLLFVGLSSDMSAQKLKESGEKGETQILIANKSGKISPKMSAKLLKAFNQFFEGYKAYKVQVSPGKGGGDLAFLMNDKLTSHILIPCLKSTPEGFILEPPTTGIRNCNKGDNCTQCKVPCGCGRNGGGGSCVEVVTEKWNGSASEMIKYLMY